MGRLEEKARRRIAGALWDKHEAAEWLGVSVRKLEHEIALGRVPFVRWGGRIVFRPRDLEEFIEGLEGVGVGEALARRVEQ